MGTFVRAITGVPVAIQRLEGLRCIRVTVFGYY